MPSKVLTPHMLRKKLYEVNTLSRNANNISTGASSNFNNTSDNDEEETGGLRVYIGKIVKMQNNNFFTDKDEKVIVYQPLPGIEYLPTGLVGGQGIITLEKPFDAIILTDGTNRYCLGFLGSTYEFAISLCIGDNKVTVHKDYVNVVSNHLIWNGLEVKKE